MSAQPKLPTGFALRAYDSLPSTNDEAKRLAAEDAPHGTIVWARTQSAGRGRRGRAWESPAGNLYATVLLRIAIPVDRATQAGFVAALALAETAEVLLPPGAEVRCKWPNDVLVGGDKVAGILLESALGPDGALAWLVIGCGLNCQSHPANSRWPATDLAAKGANVPPVAAVLERLVAALDAWLAHWQRDGFGPVRDAWLARGYGVGDTIRLEQGDTEIDGRFAGLDDDGALLLERPDGTVAAMRSGEVTMARA
jgi:BirA family biotin operon repressor/biotin-[acetyl-CoA-carboxylase] ligase